MADMHTPLKPCPFCGRTAKLIERSNPLSKWRWSVDCESTTCGSSGPVEATSSDAIEAWNRRAPSQDAETVKALREQIATKDAALRKAEQFIVNGTEYGFIRLPSSPDPALETLPTIRSALAGSAS